MKGPRLNPGWSFFHSSNHILLSQFFLHLRKLLKFHFFYVSKKLQKCLPIFLKLQYFTMKWKEHQQMKFLNKCFFWCQDPNPALQFQSQLCLLANYQITKIAWKNHEFQKIAWLGHFWKWIGKKNLHRKKTLEKKFQSNRVN